jgi:hypothetical protein
VKAQSLVRMNDYTKNISSGIFNPGDLGTSDYIDNETVPSRQRQSAQILRAESSRNKKNMEIQKGRASSAKTMEKKEAEKKILMKLKSKIEKSETRADTSGFESNKNEKATKNEKKI